MKARWVAAAVLTFAAVECGDSIKAGTDYDRAVLTWRWYRPSSADKE